jgi:hypothetical protein
MWLLDGGWNKKEYSESRGESQIFVGHVKSKNIVATIKRKEVTEYLNGDFYRAYDMWQKFKLGFGLPLPGTWAQLPKRIIDIIEYIEIVNRRIESSKSYL